MNLVNDYGKENEISQITPENHCNKELSFSHWYISIANNMPIWQKCLTFFYSSRCCFRCVFLRFSLFWNPISIAIACHRNMREGNITNMNKNQIKFYLCVYGTQTKYYLIEIKSLFVMVYFDSFCQKFQSIMAEIKWPIESR